MSFEPTGALDSKLSAQVIDLMRELSHESGQTFVIVTHDPVVAAQTSRTVFLGDGREEGNGHCAGARPCAGPGAGQGS